MHLLQLTETLRKIFAVSGIPEIPPFPSPLVEAWSHPDIYLSISGSGIRSFYTFQALEVPTAFLSDRSMQSPDLIWVTNTRPAEFSNGITEFFNEVQRQLLPGQESAVFTLIADSRRKFMFSEAGSSWKILFAGVECGRLTVYSAVPGCQLADKAAVVVSLSLKAISKLTALSPEDSLIWTDSIPVSGIVSLHAWQKSADTASYDRKQLAEKLEEAATAGEKPGHALCRLMLFFNQHARLLCQNLEVFQTFAAKIRSLREQLSCRPVKTTGSEVKSVGETNAGQA